MHKHPHPHRGCPKATRTIQRQPLLADSLELLAAELQLPMKRDGNAQLIHDDEYVRRTTRWGMESDE